MASDFVFATAKYASGDWDSAPLLPANIIDSIARYTAIPVAPKGVNVDLGTEEIFEYPFVWLTGHLPIYFTNAERRNLRLYVERGGFMVISDHNHDIDGIFHKTAYEEVQRIFGPFQKVPKDHEIYHCFFKFSDGPPPSGHELNGWGDQLMHRELFAISMGNRIGLLFDPKDYSSGWNFHPDTKQFMQVDPTKFAINLIVYALTR